MIFVWQTLQLLLLTLSLFSPFGGWQRRALPWGHPQAGTSVLLPQCTPCDWERWWDTEECTGTRSQKMLHVFTRGFWLDLVVLWMSKASWKKVEPSHCWVLKEGTGRKQAG